MAGPGVRLFISCVSGEFGTERDALRHALTRPNVEVKIQEDFKALGGDTLHMLEDYIAQCEAVVHFVGDMAGSTPATSSVADLLGRRPDLRGKLERKGLKREALAELTYTQWEAWLTIGFDKDLLIVAPAPGSEPGPTYAPSEASRVSQANHLQRLKAIDRYPTEFTNPDNLVAKILESAVIEALVKAQAAPIGAKKREPFGATIAAIVAGVFVLFVDKMLPLERGFDEIPIFIRVLAVATAGLFAWLAWRYWDILSEADAPEGSAERGEYDALLGELDAGGTPAKVYRDWLTKTLDRVDLFLGDPGRKDTSWFARALGLETTGARWTAPAFDRCLLLALLYPIVTIIAVWVWSGSVGVAERALGLWEFRADDTLPALGRAAFALLLAASGLAAWHGCRAERSRIVPWFVVACSAQGLCVFTASRFVSGGGFAIAVGPYAAAAAAVAVGLASSSKGAVAVATASAVACGFFVVATVFDSASIAGSVAIPVAVYGPAGLAFFAIAWTSKWCVRVGHQGAFVSLFFSVANILAYSGVWLLAPLSSWDDAGAVLLTLGVLTLVNTPFDWFAVGLTRALLRRGLAPGGRGPFFYAIVDAIVAAPVIALLAFVAVFAAQTFDDIAVLRAGARARILPLGPLFEGLEARPGDPEFWWVWLMLFSTLIPSALNLCIAAASLIRGLPFLNAWIVKRMQMARPLRDTDRLLLAGALAAQIAGGVLAAGVALYGIGVWLLPMWLPILGGWVRDFSEALAAYNAPARIMMWLAGGR